MTLAIFSTLAVRKALEGVVLPSFAADAGITLTSTFDPTAQLMARIEQGQQFDLIVGITQTVTALAARQIVASHTVSPLASTQVGLAVGPDDVVPDISDGARLVRALLNARSVAYSRTGASGIYFARLIRELGIADAVDGRATILDRGFTAEAVLDGRADLAVQQLSELAFVPDARIVGPFPLGFQHVTEFSAALTPASAVRDDARRLLQHLRSPRAREAYEATSLTAVPA